MPISSSIRRREISTPSDAQVLRRARGALSGLLRRHFWPHRNWFIAGTLFALVTAACGVGYGAMLAYVGNALQCQIEGGAGGACAPVEAVAEVVGAAGGRAWIWLGLGGIVALTSLRAASMYAMTLANNTGVQRGLVSIQSVQFDALTDGDFARLAQTASGNFVSRFINDVNAIRDAALRLANNLTKSLATVIGVLAYLFIIDWQLALIIAVVYPVALGPVVALGNAVRARSKKAQQQIGEVTALLSEGLQAAQTVKAYGLEAYQKDRARAGVAERSRLFLRVLSQRAGVDPVLEIVGGVAIAALLGFVAWRISDGTNTLGDLLGVIGLIGVAAPEVRALGSINTVAQEGSAAAERVAEITGASPGAPPGPGAPAAGGLPADLRGALAFEDVSFQYPDGTRALDGLSFTAEPGETVAVVGPSGAGKSTLFNLLLRLYEPSAGRILLDGVDVRQAAPEDVRRHMALVAQDAVLFDDTVGANIALGRIGADAAEIEAAARAAHADGFISDLAGGYGAPVGEAGRNLSGGQRQRIALARAILRDAPILLLDEATSALDAESEAEVQAALKRFSRGRTVLVIAHRLATVRGADRIIVLQNGRAVEAGDHDALMAGNGAYARLARLQLS
ncbi:MAG: ABC transporter ATP-binding protein [Pseudomonadota bacterium]